MSQETHCTACRYLSGVVCLKPNHNNWQFESWKEDDRLDSKDAEQIGYNIFLPKTPKNFFFDQTI